MTSNFHGSTRTPVLSMIGAKNSNAFFRQTHSLKFSASTRCSKQTLQRFAIISDDQIIF